MPRLRDRDKSLGRLLFSSSVVPKYLRRSKSMNEFLPLLYLKGISTNDFVDALKPLFGENAKNLSPGVVGRLKADWEDEYAVWCKRDLSKQRYVYWWADGIHCHQAATGNLDGCHRTYKSKGCFSRITILTMVFKLCESAQDRWIKLRGFNYLAEVVRGIKFINGVKESDKINSVNEEVAV